MCIHVYEVALYASMLNYVCDNALQGRAQCPSATNVDTSTNPMRLAIRVTDGHRARPCTSVWDARKKSPHWNGIASPLISRWVRDSSLLACKFSKNMCIMKLQS